MATEADTCRTLVPPKLYAAGGTDEQIAEQRSFTAGRIVVHGNRATRRAGKRTDDLLLLARDTMLAVVEAKAKYKKAANGLQQAKDYALILKRLQAETDAELAALVPAILDEALKGEL